MIYEKIVFLNSMERVKAWTWKYCYLRINMIVARKEKRINAVLDHSDFSGGIGLACIRYAIEHVKKISKVPLEQEQTGLSQNFVWWFVCSNKMTWAKHNPSPVFPLFALSSAILSIITCKWKTAAHKQMSDMLRELIIHLKDRSPMLLKCQTLSHPIRVESN